MVTMKLQTFLLPEVTLTSAGNPAPEFGGSTVIDWTVKLAAPMRASSAEIQVNTTAGGKHRPLAMTAPFPLGNE